MVTEVTPSRRDVIGGAALFFGSLAAVGDAAMGSRGEPGTTDGADRDVPDDNYETAIVDTVEAAESYTPSVFPAYVFVWETQQTWRITEE